MTKQIIHSLIFLLTLTMSIEYANAQNFQNDPISVALDNVNFQFGANQIFPVTTDSTRGGPSMESRYFANGSFPQLDMFLTGDVTLTFDYKFKRKVTG